MAKKKLLPRPYDPAATEVEETATLSSDRYPDIYRGFSPGVANRCITHEPGRYTIATDNGDCFLHLTVLDEHIWRLCYGFSDQPGNFSYALAPEVLMEIPTVELREDEGHFNFRCGETVCRISRHDLRFHFLDADDERTILRDAEAFYTRSTILQGRNHLRLTLEAPKKAAYLGLGDKVGHLDLRGRYFVNWNSDVFSYGEGTDPLYRSIPFYYCLHKQRAHGLFLHGSWRSHFDFDSAGDGCTRIWTEGGELDFFYLGGPTPLDVARRYHQLTGVPELPPLWALGFHQCRWSYYPEARVKQIAEAFRAHRIPCDAIYLDIDYMDGYRCFTWNNRYFPDPKRMIAELREQGFHIVVMIDPGIRVDDDYSVYREGLELDAFCRRTTGELMTGPVWPPVCVWPDYTRPQVRQWWGQLYRELYQEQGVSGFWNDMNEPAVFKVSRKTFPDTVLHDFDGHPTDHQEAHNVYGQQMSRATYEGLKLLQPDKRPFVLTRASFSGGQRYAALWTGDNVSSWEHLRLANLQCQRLSLSGFSFCGTDIGGFVDIPSGELFVRWLQLGAFHALFRVHSMGNNVDGASEADAAEIKLKEAAARLDQEPWSYGEPYTSQARAAIEFRYQLLPYLYTAFYQHVTTGEPLLRSLAFQFPEDKQSLAHEEEFLCGRHLLVSPVLQPKVRKQLVYFPPGQWLDYTTGESHAGGKKAKLRVKPDRLPLFVRAGAVLPHYPVMQYTGEKSLDTVTLRVYYGSAEDSEWYVDEGEGYAYQEDHYQWHRFQTLAEKNWLSIRHQRTGRYAASVQVFLVEVYGFPGAPTEVTIDGQPIQEVEIDKSVVRFMAPLDFSDIQLK